MPEKGGTMRKRIFMTMGSLALALLPGIAAAQDEAPPTTAPPPPQSMQPQNLPPDVCPPGTSPAYRTEAPAAPAQPRLGPDYAPHQVALSTGGGVASFVRERITDG